jgi:ElaB/YqjD/DUF883 family membrane-anchored ribosome-binding protein
MTQPTHSSSSSRDNGRNPAVPNPSLADAGLTDADLSESLPGTTAAIADSRIDYGAERVKQATSEAVARTKQAVNTAADKVEAGVHRATDKAAGAAHVATDKAVDLGERGRQLRDEGMDKAEVWMSQAREYVREKPMQSVAIALGAGWLLGRILRR